MNRFENFLNQNPADFTLRDRLMAQSNERNETSLLCMLADEFALAGSNSLKGMEVNLIDESFMFNSPIPSDLPEVAAIIWGNLVRQLTSCQDNSVFDMGTFVTGINRRLEGTIIPRFTVPNETSAIISSQKLDGIKKTLRNSPTYTIMFNSPFHLPYNVRKYLTEKRFFTSQNSALVVSEWDKRAKAVLGIGNELIPDIENILHEMSLSVRDPERAVKEGIQVLEEQNF